MPQDRLVLHQPGRRVNHHKCEFHVFSNKPRHTVRFPDLCWALTRSTSLLSPPPKSTLPSDAQGPEANVSAACNYPQCPYAVWEEWKGLTSFWPSAALRFLSHPSLSPARPISNSSLRGLSVSVSLCLINVCLVCNVCMSVATFPSSNIFVWRIFPVSLVTKHWRVSPFDCKSLRRLYKLLKQQRKHKKDCSYLK